MRELTKIKDIINYMKNAILNRVNKDQTQFVKESMK